MQSATEDVCMKPVAADVCVSRVADVWMQMVAAGFVPTFFSSDAHLGELILQDWKQIIDATSPEHKALLPAHAVAESWYNPHQLHSEMVSPHLIEYLQLFSANVSCVYVT